MGWETLGGQMSGLFVRFVSRVLIVCVAALPLQLQAGMIGTAEAVSAERAQTARDALRGIVDRAAAAGKLQAHGITAQQAHARIAALTDLEAASLAARAERLPAGADGAAIGLLVIIVFLIYHFWVAPAMKPEAKKDDKKK